jgi:type I restriction enzyme S subunit
MNEWTDLALGEVLTLQRGFDLAERERVPGSVPIVSSSGVTGYHDTPKVKAPGVVTGRYGTLGEVFFVNEDFWPLNTTLWVKDFKGNDPRFVSFLLRTLNLAQQNAAGAVPGINRNALHLLPVKVPSSRIQRRIASILSAYDDLIENNTRRIKIVKEIGSTVFTSAASQSPGDWETVPIREVYSGFFDGPHATPKPSDEGPVFLGIKNVTESGELDLTDIRHIAEDDFQQWTRRVVPEFGDIVFSYEATLYRYAIINRGFRGCLGRRLALIRPNPEKIDAYILLRCLLSDEWRREVQSKVISGATVDRIPLVTFPNFMIRVPNRKLQERIGPTIRACEELAENCRRRNDLLRKTRDLLLPKLISGEISTKAAENGAAAIEEEIALHA